MFTVLYFALYVGSNFYYQSLQPFTSAYYWKERKNTWLEKERKDVAHISWISTKIFQASCCETLYFEHAKDTNGCVTQSITSSKPSLANSSSKLVSFQIQCFLATCFISSAFMLHELLWTFFRLKGIHASRLWELSYLLILNWNDFSTYLRRNIRFVDTKNRSSVISIQTILSKMKLL